jgi:hypothetical protein
MAVTRLTDDQPWAEVTIPGSDRPVRLRRLHVDPLTKASLSVVCFPPGWRRQQTGYYDCAEEFTVLRGNLTVSGVTHRAGDHAYLPPRAIRVDSATDDGCLALAYFSAPPHWTGGQPATPADHPPRHGPPDGVLRRPRPGVQGGCEVLTEVPVLPATEECDVLSLPTADWAWVPAGEEFPDVEPPLLLRTWTKEA